jgi:DNA-binding transcriptional ArsR family regulator
MAGVDGVLTATAQMSFHAAERGDLRNIGRFVADLKKEGPPESRAWRLALEAVHWSFDPAAGPAPRLESARAAASTATAPILTRLCAVMERVAFCAFDADLLASWTDLHAQLHALAAGNVQDLTLPAARLWQRVLAGAWIGVEETARSLGDEASRQSDAATVIESTVVRGLAALSSGHLDEAIELGRRASRMAQAESLSHHEYLAHLTLARVRRYSGRPHLALHILAALARVAPLTWSGWIGWETLLAGGAVPDRGAFDGPAARAQQSLGRLLDAARGADRTAFDRAAADARQDARIWPPLAEEIDALVAALDPVGREVPASMRAWSAGETAAIPFGLHGVGLQRNAEPQTDAATAYVVARPGETGRRMLLPGLGLAPAARLLARDSTRPGARTETGIAALALAGAAGDSRDGFFRSVYGFPFVPYRHRAVLDTLCHRMRTMLGSAGEIRRDDSDGGPAADPDTDQAGPVTSTPTIALGLREAIVVPDMRCTLPTADRVLRALALRGSTSASAAAERLRMPLRTVQAVLQQLVSEGACTTERDGRRVVYKIEDTTFTQVTSA